MTRIDLVKVASHLYHTAPENEFRQQIYAILKTVGLHPKTPIASVFNENLASEIKRVQIILKLNAAHEAAILKPKKTTRKWK